MNDPALVLSLESELEQARTALSALEEARAAERLRRVEADLIAHPYLPQATFLMGECLALEAQAAREHDPARAQLLEARRQTLEGPRAAAFGENATPPPAPQPSQRELSGLASVDELELDGMALGDGGRAPTLAPGLHHVRVLRRGRLIFASFVSIEPEQAALALAVPPLVPCSAEDFDGVVPGKATAPGVACSQWAQVRADPSGGIDVALCRREQCGAFTHWQRRAAPPFAPIAAERSHLLGWAGFALAGGVALVASGLVLWQAGAFDRGHPTATTWEYGGLNPQGIRF